ncbi:MAG: YIP1 family protein [Eubacteriales bacterium]
MKKIFVTAFLLVMVAVFCLGTYTAAYAPYETYTYSINGDTMTSKHAYDANDIINAETISKNSGVTVEFGNNIGDFCTDSRGWVYILDQTSEAGFQPKLVVLNHAYELQYIITNFNSDAGKNDKFKNPQGVYVSDDRVYVCDTGNNRLVVFNLDGSYYKTVTAPKSSYFKQADNGDGTVVAGAKAMDFDPVSCVADRYGRLFVIASSCNQGVIVMDEDSNFTGFIGAQKATYSLFDMFFRRFESEEERASRVDIVSINLNRLALEHGTYGDFIYAVTKNTDNESNQESALTASGSSRATYSPVKKLNTKGDEIMKRNGFFDCGGEVKVKRLRQSSTIYGVSTIVDVAVGPEGSWTIADNKRSKVFTYDSNGQLLYAFGDFSETFQLGTISPKSLNAIDYQYNPTDGTYNLLMLDGMKLQITVYVPTDYNNLLIEALRNDNERRYNESIDYWTQILGENNNFDAAYVGVGKALYYNGEYDEAMEYLSAAKETDFYAKALSAKSQDNMTNHPLVLILVIIGVIVLVLLFLRLMKYAKRINYQGNFKSGRRTYWEELMYGFYVSFHPFDGFWDIKHEHRGSVRAGLTILMINVCASYYASIGRSYLANPSMSYSSFFSQILAFFVPVILWSVANWCLTTLFNGEGTFKQIFITTCYATAPLPWFLVLGTVMTNVSATFTDGFVSFITAIGFIWVGFLLFFGTMVVQDYSLGKNVVTTLGTILSMAVIMFVVILFTSLVGDMISFVSGLATEISYRS